MSRSLYTDLAWLPRPPADFPAQCKAALASEKPGAQLRALSSYGLNESQLNQLAKTIRKAQEEKIALTPLTPLRLGVISNATTHFIIPALIATAPRYGIALECIEGNFDQAMQESLASDSAINAAKSDAVLVALDYRGLRLRAAPGDSHAEQETLAAANAYLNTMRAGIKAGSNAVCILQTLARPLESHFGNFDLALPGTLRRLIDGFNQTLAESVGGSEDLLFDVAHLAESVGLADWHDPALWSMAKLPFASIFLPLYADHVCRILGALRGKSRRCLILDLDNTLWGGIIGDDGLEGIVIGQGDPVGEAYLQVQQAALTLRDRGIVLAVSSKNDDAMARLPFQQHPEMQLREDHIAVFQANWNDKATNIQAIAETLSLGLDSIVFLDNDPVERGLVRTLLPQVAVPELPSDPALYARTLLAGGYFEAIAFSEEDRKRADFYSNNAQRVALQKQAGDVGAYLASLNMVMTVQPFDEVGRVRITQLINKSNQYNLTTRRYTEAQVAQVQHDPDYFALQVRLSDNFGDNGMIGVIICRRTGSDWEIDTWLMSCRVLGRKVEHAVLQEIILAARQRGIEKLIGIFCPSERNQLAADHYSKLGFSEYERRADGPVIYTLAVAHAPKDNIPIEIRRSI